MARLKGILKHRWSEKQGTWSGEIKEDKEKGSRYTNGLKEFDLKEDWRGQKCEFELDDSQKIIAIWYEGESVPVNAGLLEESKKKEEQKKANALARKQEEKRLQTIENLNNSTSYNPLLAKFLPADTQELLSYIPQGPENYSLKLNITSNVIERKSKNREIEYYFIPYERDRSSGQERKYQPAANFGLGTDPKVFEHFGARKKLFASSQCKEHVSLTLPQDPDSRLALGLGTASVFETGITLHHVYGFPYIPASSVKGVVRSWIVQCCFDGKEEDAIADKSFCDMFGCPAEAQIDDENGNRIKKTYSENGKKVESNPRSYYRVNDEDKLGGERQGNLIFFDAFPTHAPTIKEDIMNPHYPDYYRDGKAPADYQSPVPVMFLTVEKTTFQFIIGFNPLPGMEEVKVSGPIARQLSAKDSELTLLEAGKKWLIKALSEHGIGAKTAVGYGFFQPQA